MYKYVVGYLWGESTIVLNKSDIQNTKDEQFREVSIYLPFDFIRESSEELEYMADDEEEEE